MYSQKPLLATGPKNVNTAVKKIVDLNIDVDWAYVLDDIVEVNENRAIDNLFREYLADGSAEKPVLASLFLHVTLLNILLAGSPLTSV